MKKYLTESKIWMVFCWTRKRSLEFSLKICFCVPGKTENMGLEGHEGE